MDLGKRIAEHRKALGLSQEALGEHLGVSRQAVSKWETGAAAPDMENLMSLAREFHVSLAELTGTPEDTEPAPAAKSPVWYFLFPIFCALAGAMIVGTLLQLFSGPPSEKPAAPPPEQPAASKEAHAAPLSPATDFSFLWTNEEGETEFLELGRQESLFPFGTSLELTEPETVLNTDFGSLSHHIADCGAIQIEYDRMEDGAVYESLTKFSTISRRVQTSRFIGPGSTQADLLEAYGDELIYCLKEEGGYSLVAHDHFYAYTDGPLTLLFYVDRGEVQGVLMENLMDGAGLYEIDHIHRFPMVNGEPDFSLRREPEQEPLSDARRVYIAFNQLVANNNLSAEERYACRRDVFGALPEMDWQEYTACSGTYEEPDVGFWALMDWLARQESFSPSEILWLQMGAAAKGLDGAYTEMYCHVLSRALFYDPVEFAKQLAVDGIPEETMDLAIRLTVYDAYDYPVETETAVNVLQKTLDDGGFTDTQAGWAQQLMDALTAQ